MDPWRWDAVVPVGMVEHALGVAYGQEPDAWGPWCLHPRHVLEWIDADGMRTRVRGVDGDRPFARPAGRWHLYAAGTAYCERYARPDRIRAHGWFFFVLRAAPPALAGRAFAAIDDPEDRLGNYLRAMFAAQQRGEAHAAAQRHGLLWAALGEVLTAAGGEGDGSPSRPWVVRAAPPPSLTLLARLDAAVSRRLADPPSVAELAEQLRLSPSRLAHRLAAESGTSVVARLRWLRVREARRLLGAGASVKEAAARLGFSSPTYFARVFRAVAGVTPLEYQDRLRARRG